MRSKWFFMFLFIFAGYAAIAQENEITVAGSGSNEGIVKELAAAFIKSNPGSVVNVPASIGTDGGINGCVEGKFVLGRIGRPLKDAEKKLGITELLFCKMPIVIIVNQKVTVKNLTAAQICDIYAGKITNWKEVGGNDKKIYLLSRNPGESSLNELQKNLPGFKEITISDKAIIVQKDPEMIEKAEQKDGTIGFGASANMKGRKVNIITIDKIAMASDQYRLFTIVGLVYKEELSGLAKKFVDFIYSARGTEIIKQNYCIPLKR